MEKKKQVTTTRCPYCDNKMPAAALVAHIQRKHSSGYAGVQSKGSPAPQTVLPRRKVDKPAADGRVRCPQCRKMVYQRYMAAHREKHEREKSRPVWTDAERNQAAAPDTVPGVNDQNPERNQRSKPPPSPSSEMVWYRDSDGDLQLGHPPSGVQQNGDRDKEETTPKIYAATRPTNRTRTRKIHIETAIKAPEGFFVTCPVCRQRMQKDQYQNHLLEHPEYCLCPACNRLVKIAEFLTHMTTHNNWCPICSDWVVKLHEHLKRGHHLRLAVTFGKFYQPSWRTKPNFICELCEERISLDDVASHFKPHKLVANTDTSPNKVSQTPANNHVSIQKENIPVETCPVCHKRIKLGSMEIHMALKHFSCPYCNKKLPVHSIRSHIDRRHPGMPKPKLPFIY